MDFQRKAFAIVHLYGLLDLFSSKTIVFISFAE